MDPSKLLDWIKLSPTHLLAFFLASGLLVFGRDTWIQSLGLLEFRDTYRIWIGVPFLASGALLAAHALTRSSSFLKQRITWRRNLKRLQGRLDHLSPPERQVLREYIYPQTKTCYFGIDNGVVQGLVAGNVLYRSANVGDIFNGFAYNIQPWAWDYLNVNPHLLEDLPQDGLVEPSAG